MPVNYSLPFQNLLEHVMFTSINIAQVFFNHKVTVLIYVKTERSNALLNLNKLFCSILPTL